MLPLSHGSVNCNCCGKIAIGVGRGTSGLDQGRVIPSHKLVIEGLRTGTCTRLSEVLMAGNDHLES